MSAREVPVSVVIPTLGGESLVETIRRIELGTRVPREILICVPEGFAVPAGFPPKVRVLRTPEKGQVRQRIFGFVDATQPMVLQLDDDIWLDSVCLEMLVQCIESRPDASVSPSLLERSTGLLTHWLGRPRQEAGIVRRALYWLVNGRRGYQPGRISRAGIGMGFSDEATESYEVDWLPGGCALHHRHNAVTENFYPFVGKAYAEDLFHADALRGKRVRMFHCPAAVCRFDSGSSKSSGVMSFIRIQSRNARALIGFAAQRGRVSWRLIAFLALWPIALIVERYRSRPASTSTATDQ